MSETAVRATPELKLPESPSFMVVGGKTYFIENVEQSPDSMMKLVEQYYEENLNVLRQKVSKHISEEALQDLDRQLSRIERHVRAGVVVLPEGLRDSGTVLTLYNNKVYETLPILFRPTRISCTVQRLNDYVQWIASGISRKDAERFTKFMEWGKPIVDHYRGIREGALMSGTKVDITVDQDIVVSAMTASYIREEQRIMCYPLNTHPHVYSDGKLCTGNVSAQVFWEDPQFNANFNSLNPHSFANSGTPGATRLQELLKNQYFVSGAVREQEVTGWRVS